MKKRICFILIFVILFILINFNNSEATELYLGEGQLNILYNTYENWVSGQQEAALVSELKSNYGYPLEEIKNPLRISTTVSIVGKSFGKYGVKLGNNKLIGKNIDATLNIFNGNWYVSENTLRDVLGYEDSFGKLEKGTTWKIVVEAYPKGPFESKLMSDHDDSLVQTVYWDYMITASKIWSGPDAEKVWGTQPDVTADVDANSESFVDKAKELAEFLTHIVESAATGFFNWIISLGDGLQQMANFAQTWTLEKSKLMYTPSEIQSAAGGGTNTKNGEQVVTGVTDTKTEQYDNIFDNPLNVNSYLNYKKTDASTGENTATTRFIKQSDQNGQKHNFTKDTPIPVITSDIYTIAAGKVNSIKTNFFERSSDGGVFSKVIDFVASVIHMLMFIVTGFVITATIWHGVGLSKTSIIGDINEQNKHKQAIRKLVISLILVVSTVFIEALCIYLSEAILEKDKVETGEYRYEGPIRVTVEKLYSFSTTPTGYVRYMAGLDNIYLYAKKGGYACTYLILALSNFLLTYVMFVRSFIMLLASIIGFWLILVYSYKSQDASLVPYLHWFVVYLIISLIQVALAILARVMLVIVV